ncbi:hypothetical protein [Chryseolinea lacunae]|uniref:DUF2975 domain-containing protein n=1 Tax=Chryseolinea lacunae TaxID=2801331 RepID=A0ABS1KRY7_9BACT|nr:hypothetical protein [Chryseolinea lacunae]MBL0741051.1 hypothetical protein [Chryseolinea lacunae]
MKKLILTSILGGILVLAIGMLIAQVVQALFPALQTEYQNVHLFRTQSDPAMLVYFVHPFFFSMAFAWVWKKTRALSDTGSNWRKAIRFAFACWIVSTVPGMMISYASFPISLLMTATWAVSALAEFTCLGLLFSKLMNETSTHTLPDKSVA